MPVLKSIDKMPPHPKVSAMIIRPMSGMVSDHRQDIHFKE
jgi:hypothetical protein